MAGAPVAPGRRRDLRRARPVPYIRESRRIRAERTIVEQDVTEAVQHHDSIEIGSYRPPSVEDAPGASTSRS